MTFDIQSKDQNSKARTGVITTDHGKISTPIFMPVGTIATVKSVHQRELLNDIKADIILGNTYHLYLRPETDILQKAGGLHKFMNWPKNILTDSGGYQVYSLSERRKITEEGVKFKSHIDGSMHWFSPENVMDTQRLIGADIMMAFDECPPYPTDYQYAKRSMHMTHRWLERCIKRFDETEDLYSHQQHLFPILQGSTYKDLRQESAKYIVAKDMPGNAIGGLSVGEPNEKMYEITDMVTDILPKEKPRYLMGVGTPIDLLENIALGIDMFDCVMPTRNARNGMIFTSEGSINIKNLKWRDDFSPLDKDGTTWVDHEYSKAYVRHLFTVNELLAKQICSIHNLGFYLKLVRQATQHIEAGSFISWKTKMIDQLQNRL
ncbi:tRNA guanosine(34) transglycosylase Tgt [Flavobacterium sp. CS20]|uniref:tRNA guanosine(34) transglycosylase Tgt n=1 Tax=Flavobacterium sp. CS20 TaxID=2775246 RepID=UPI001B3A1EF9|nr:tRNA guanosine(34) transglycosylase Tgt [Flavobacterium sp. CS20]QTY27513.1 tRNA guanosine(34) transglycosylase Tgt [Flavobacterium sp. CS20]